MGLGHVRSHLWVSHGYGLISRMRTGQYPQGPATWAPRWSRQLQGGGGTETVWRTFPCRGGAKSDVLGRGCLLFVAAGAPCVNAGWERPREGREGQAPVIMAGRGVGGLEESGRRPPWLYCWGGLGFRDRRDLEVALQSQGDRSPLGAQGC